VLTADLEIRDSLPPLLLLEVIIAADRRGGMCGSADRMRLSRHLRPCQNGDGCSHLAWR
jgi:hypothetical protein